MILDTTTRKLQVLVDAGATTTESPVVASFVDLTTTTTTPGSSNTITNGGTAVDIVAAPAGSTQRQIIELSIENADTVTHTYTVRYNDNGTTRIIIKMAVLSGQSLTYSTHNGWEVPGGSETAAVASTVPITDESADTTCFFGFYTAATGNQAVHSNSNATFNAATGAAVFANVSCPQNTTGEHFGAGSSAGLNGVAVGNGTIATTNAVAIGQGVNASGNSCITIGVGATNSGNGVVIGPSASTTFNSTVVIGNGATVTSSAGTAIGAGATASASSVACGSTASATGVGATSLGQGTTCAFNFSIVLGISATATATAQLTIGSTGSPINEVRFPGGAPAFTLHSATTTASFKGAASRTAPILQLQTSAGASLGNVGGVIFNSFTDTSTTHTDGTEDDLYSYTLVANTFAINGDAVWEIEHVQFVASATAARRLKKYFAGTLIFDSGALTLTLGGDFTLETVVIRESSSVVRVTVNVVTTSASSIPYATYTRITGLTLTGTNILKTTGIASGTGAASGDIVNKLSKVSTLPAA